MSTERECCSILNSSIRFNSVLNDQVVSRAVTVLGKKITQNSKDSVKISKK